MFGRRRVLGLVTVLMLALLLAACGGGSRNQQSSSPAQTQSTPAASSTDSGVRVIELVFDDFTFGPEEIRVKSGERVRLSIRNNGSVAHDWYVEDLDLGTPLIQPGQTATFEFTAGEAGRYGAYCTEPGHEALGMVGVLIIES